MRQFCLFMIALLAVSCKVVTPSDNTSQFVEKGIASWYGPGFQGKQTANGERFNTNEPTADHKTLSFNTVILVEN